MLYDLSKHYHVLEEKRSEALIRFKDDEYMTDWLNKKCLDNTLYEFEKGIYETNLNFNYMLRDWFGIEYVQEFDNFNKYKLSTHNYNFMFPIEFKSDYGVCDNYQQVLHKYPELTDSKDYYVVSLARIRKKDQPSRLGWRWEKWGAYIGIQKSKAYYLYDEPEIEEVFCYHILKVVPNLRKYTRGLKWLNYKDLKGKKVDLSRISKIDSLSLSSKEKRKLYFNREMY